MQDKIDIAIEFMKEGKFFRVGDLRLGRPNSKEIEVSGWSVYLNLKNITKRTAVTELIEIKSLFSDILNKSPRLMEFAHGKYIKYILLYDDGGKGSIVICEEKNDKVSWLIHLND